MPQGKTTEVRWFGRPTEPSGLPAASMILRAGLSQFPGLCQGEFRGRNDGKLTTRSRGLHDPGG